MRKLLILTLVGGLLFLNSGYAFAGDRRELTVQQAVEMAWNHSSALRAAGYNIEKSKYDRDAAADKVEYTPTGQASPEAEIAFNKLVQADINWQAAKKNYQAQQDSIRLSVYQAYCSILQNQAMVESAQEAVYNAELQYRAAQLSYQVGSGSKWNVQQKQNDLVLARSDLAAAQKTLEDSYMKFNQLLGLSLDERPQLVEQPAFSPFSVASLEAEFSRVLDESPTVWQARQSVTQAKIALDIYSFSNSEAHTYDSMETSVSIAEQNAKSAEEKAAQTVRSLYNSIQQLEQTRTGLVQKLEKARNDLLMTEAKFKNGTANKLELAAARYAVVQAQKSLLDTDCQHAILVEAFKTPWAYGG